ncbi:hypothetical protein ACFFMN_23270 [Planobispora siamensis]|uniref:Uncharacterized protein n=1 Tax=Planobispora siamensis TaxID=936338 RepID=A0A8J3WMS6_9ACTN|nr:hypothetical protein [Planobispora siamensis]GIH95283.1 hypothetical protein Psi01_59130 [Planobispora siamensis]
MTPMPPPPLRLEASPWVVYVTREVAEHGLDILGADRRAWEDLTERYEAGQMSEEEYLEAIGPEPGYRPIDIYGPYTERQADTLATYLSQPEIKTKYGISTAVPGVLTRFIA